MRTKTITGNNTILIKMLIYAYLICYLILVVIPANPIKPNISFNLLLNLSFLILVVCTAVITYKIIPTQKVKNTKDSNKEKMSYAKFNFILNTSAFASLIGLLLVFYDRVFIRGINYSSGLRSARYQWMESAEEGLGGSLPSVVGNMIIPFAYVSFLMAFIHYDKLPKRNRNIIIISGLIVVFAHSALNGGRSNIFILVTLLITISILRKCILNKYLPKIKNVKLKVIGLFVISIIFALQIFASSSDMSEINYEMQSRLGLTELHGETDQRFEKIGQITDYEYLTVLFLAYLVHGQWTAQETSYLSDRYGEFTFVSYKQLLYQVGLLRTPPNPNYFSETGTFISLPGALFYDYGLVGVIISSSFIGVLFSIVLILLSTNSIINGTKLAFILFVLVLLYLSPILPAHGFTYFNFVIFAFILMDLVSRFLFGNSGWFDVESHLEFKTKKTEIIHE